jgi:hypothetical protein
MIRKDVKVRISRDIRGKITSGAKSTNTSGKEHPVSLDYFNIKPFEELRAVYGEKPQRMLLYFPTNDLQDWFSSEYSAWGGKGSAPIKKRSCNGMTCHFNIDEEIKGNNYSAGLETACICKKLDLTVSDKKSCGCYTGFKAFVADPENGKILHHICYLFQTMSKNSGDALISELYKISKITSGNFVGVPFVLSVKMVHAVVDGVKKKYPIWSIQVFGDMQKLLSLSEKSLLPVGSGFSGKPDALQIEYEKSISVLRSLTFEQLTKLYQKYGGDRSPVSITDYGVSSFDQFNDGEKSMDSCYRLLIEMKRVFLNKGA